MKSLLEFMRLLRYAQARMSVDWCQWRYDRARFDLADAHDAADRAYQDLQLQRPPPPPPAPDIPEYLRVEPIGESA